jgi:hypothetical protein
MGYRQHFTTLQASTACYGIIFLENIIKAPKARKVKARHGYRMYRKKTVTYEPVSTAEALWNLVETPAGLLGWFRQSLHKKDAI